MHKQKKIIGLFYFFYKNNSINNNNRRNNRGFSRISNGKNFFIIIFLLVASCTTPNENYRPKYEAMPLAPSFTTEKTKNLDYLGSKVVDGGVNFNLYAENATRIELLLFDNPDSDYPSQIFTMSRYYNTWSVFVSGIGAGTYYGYRAWGPNWDYDSNWYPNSTLGFKSDCDVNGNRYNPNKLLMDPYARAYHRDHDWSKASAASGPYRHESTIGAAAKSIVVDSQYQWSETAQKYWSQKQTDTLAGHGPEDLIVYEVSLKGLTKGATLEMGVSHPGTYRGVGEMAGYLRELGITAVEFLPIHEKSLDGGYWGYQTIGFFAPEVSYGYEPKRGSQVDEFKWMVDKLHSHGIAVILDVVFNHTGEGGLWREHIPMLAYTDPDRPWEFWNYDPPETASLLTFRGIDNQAYYQLNPYDPNANKCYYYEHTGVGNALRANHTPGKRLILDSLRYWVEEMHVDGFRFDLGSVLGERDKDYDNWSGSETVLQEIVDDPVFQKYRTRMIAEPWDLARYKVGSFPVASNFSESKFAWYEWNGAFRDWTRQFVNYDAFKLNSIAQGFDGGSYLTGSQGYFGEGSCPACDPRAPYHSVNFITAHDGFTLYDLLSYNEKRNGVGPLNPDGLDPNSGDSHNNSYDWSASGEAYKRQIYRNLATLLFLSRGSPMMLGGDEWMRTQYGNNNAYTPGADNHYNWFRWPVWQNDLAAQRMFDFYKGVIALRKAHKYAFAPTSFNFGTMATWKKADGVTDADTTTWSNKNIGIYYHTVGSGNPRIYICINMDSGDVSFTLPAGVNWLRRLDTQSFFENSVSAYSGNVFADTTTTFTNYNVKGRSIVIFIEKI